MLVLAEFWVAERERLNVSKIDDEQDETLRLASFSNLIATLPAAHFATLKSIFASITR